MSNSIVYAQGYEGEEPIPFTKANIPDDEKYREFNDKVKRPYYASWIVGRELWEGGTGWNEIRAKMASYTKVDGLPGVILWEIFRRNNTYTEWTRDRHLQTGLHLHHRDWFPWFEPLERADKEARMYMRRLLNNSPLAKECIKPGKADELLELMRSCFKFERK